MKLVQKGLFILFYIGRVVLAGEGTIDITGTGEATIKPEFAEVRVNVTSICYEKSVDAKNANAVMANQVVEILKKYVRAGRDKVTAVGGQNVRQSEIVYLPQGGSKTLCERKWKASNTITLQTASIDDVPLIQDEVLNATDGMDAASPNKGLQTYAELMQPNFLAYPESVATLHRKSQARAWEDAQAQLATFKEKCNFKNAELKSISEPHYTAYPGVVDRPLIKESVATPLLPENILVRAIWRFVWTFEQSGNCRQ